MVLKETKFLFPHQHFSPTIISRVSTECLWSLDALISRKKRKEEKYITYVCRFLYGIFHRCGFCINFPCVQWWRQKDSSMFFPASRGDDVGSLNEKTFIQITSDACASLIASVFNSKRGKDIVFSSIILYNIPRGWPFCLAIFFHPDFHVFISYISLSPSSLLRGKWYSSLQKVIFMIFFTYFD